MISPFSFGLGMVRKRIVITTKVMMIMMVVVKIMNE